MLPNIYGAVTAFTWGDLSTLVSGEDAITNYFTTASAISIMSGIVGASLTIYLTWTFGRKALKSLVRVFRGKSIRV